MTNVIYDNDNNEEYRYEMNTDNVQWSQLRHVPLHKYTVLLILIDRYVDIYYKETHISLRNICIHLKVNTTKQKIKMVDDADIFRIIFIIVFGNKMFRNWGSVCNLWSGTTGLLTYIIMWV